MTTVYSKTTTAVNLHFCVATIAAYRYERKIKDIDQDSLLTLKHKNKKYGILILVFIVKFHRVSHKLFTKTRTTTTAVNLYICVATIAAHRYEDEAKKINEFSFAN